MIFKKCIMTITNNTAKLDEDIYLYRLDKNVDLYFTIVNSKYKFNKSDMNNIIELTKAAYFQVRLYKNAQIKYVFAIQPTDNGDAILRITEDLIDEPIEVGDYDLQISLLDEEKQSMVSMPIVSKQFHVCEPLVSEDALTGKALLGLSKAGKGEIKNAFDKDGNYIREIHANGEVITAELFNKWEETLEQNTKSLNEVKAGSSCDDTQVKQDINTIKATIGTVELTTTDKTLKGGVNELSSQIKDIETRIDNIGGSEGNIQPITQVEPEELDMPKVFFYGTALPTSKTDVNLTMDYVSNTTKFSSYIKLKCQGTSSMSYAKKNFTINMYSDEARETKLKKDFKGWGAQSKFCLKANYVDTTHTRNLSGARIAYDMVASRPDSPFKQQLLTAPRNGAVDGFPIKLYFNGEFYGIYTWNIPKDAWMFNMDKSNPNHVVLCAEKNTDGNANLINSCQFRQLWTNGDGNDWSVEVGTYNTDLQTKFNRVIAFVKDSTDEEFKANISQYLDLYSLLDYYCFSYLTCHLDGLAKNMLMATYDGVIWGACLYDMDSIYGVNWNGNSYVATNYQCPEQYQEQFSLLWQRIERCFGAELYARYLELRQGALSLSNIIKHVEEIYDVIPDRVFADEKAKWTSLPQVNTNTMTRFRNYMRDRAVYVDAQMQEIGTKVPCTGIVLSADTLSFTTTNTQTLSVVVSPTNCTDTVTWSVSPSGIVTVNNGVVTPITNGSCTITATCGTQTATCNVTVSGMSESGGDTDIYATAEYAITEARTFNGTSDYIDTGIKLFDTAKTFTIFVDYTTSGTVGVGNATVFHCLHEASPYRGLCLMENNGDDDTYFIGGQASDQSAYASDVPSNGKYLISFADGVINEIVTVDNSGNLVYSATDMASNNPYVQISENLLIGCYQNTSGTKGRYWTGTINKFGVWFKQLTENEINTLLSPSLIPSNLLEGVSWSASADNGINNNSNQGTVGEEKGSGNGDAYLSGQIPCGKKKYVLSNINGATFIYKEIYVYASDGTFLGGHYGNGKYNANGQANETTEPITMDLRNISEEPAYMKITVYPNNVATNNDPANQLELIAYD